MLQRNLHPWQRPMWQTALAEAIRNSDELMDLLDLPREPASEWPQALRTFQLRVPRSYVARMRKGDLDDPLLRQVLPHRAEDVQHPSFNSDPVGDLSAMVAPGLLHKYQGRALLVTTGACGVHCRYCFRRHFPYAEANPAVDQWQQALAHIANDTSISEVILSGGDPLSLPDWRLADLADHIAALSHVKRLRIHTRMPIVLPERVDEQLVNWLTALPLQKIIVVHANHANEIDTTTANALRRLRDCNVTLFNQSVLLRGVNDSPPTLANLSETLFAAGVIPYYLHLLDKVQGAAHFAVSDAEAEALIEDLRHRLPGYLVPKLVCEVPGEASKRAIM